MLKKLSLLLSLALGSFAIANADTITGFVSVANGTDVFSNSNIKFEPGAVVGGTVGGTFATYLVDGNPFTFTPNLAYTQGANTEPGVGVQLFSVTNGSETFTYFVKSFDANFGTGLPGCNSGDTCLDITGQGFFVGTGVKTFTDSFGTFQFDSSYVPGQTVGATITTFAAQAEAPPIPEPFSLVLFGTGLLGGVFARKFKRGWS